MKENNKKGGGEGEEVEKEGEEEKEEGEEHEEE